MLSKKIILKFPLYYVIVIASCFTPQINGMGGLGGVPDIPYQYASYSNHSPVPPTPLLVEYAEAGNLSGIRDLLTHSRQSYVEDLTKAVQVAAASGQSCVLEFLIQQPEIQQKLPTVRWSFFNAGRNHTQIARIMIDAGAPLESALYHSCSCTLPCDHFKATQLLLQHGAQPHLESVFLIPEGECDYIKLFLEYKADPNQYKESIYNEVAKSCLQWTRNKVVRLLALYGARIQKASPEIIKEKIIPALSPAMFAATNGDTLALGNIIMQIDSTNITPMERIRRLFRPYSRQAGLNAALRYASANAQLQTVQFLLDQGANPFASCPDVADYVKTSDALVRHLLTSPTIKSPTITESLEEQQYKAIRNLFQTHEKAHYFKARELYWHLRALNLPLEMKILIIEHLLETTKVDAEAIVAAFEKIEKERRDKQLSPFAYFCLSSACKLNFTKIIADRLLQPAYSPNMSYKGENLFHVARTRKMGEFLVLHGAEIDILLKGCTDKNKYTPLEEKVATFKVEYIPYIQFLLEHGAQKEKAIEIAQSALLKTNKELQEATQTNNQKVVTACVKRIAEYQQLLSVLDPTSPKSVNA